MEEAADRGAPLIRRVEVEVVAGIGQVDELHPLTAGRRRTPSRSRRMGRTGKGEASIRAY